MPDPKPLRAAVIYPYFPHYREPVMRELMRPASERSNITYTFVSDTTCPLPNLRLVDPALVDASVEGRRLRWRFLRTGWLKGPLHWQHGVLRLCWAPDLDVLIVLGNVTCISNWLLAPLARLFGKRVLWWTHGLIKPSSPRHRILSSLLARLAHGLLVYGHGGRRNLAAQGVDERNLYVVYNSLDHSAQVALRETLDADLLFHTRRSLFPNPDYPVLLWIGRLTSVKQLDWILRAAADLEAQDRPVNVLMVGDGPERASLEALAASLGLQNRVHFFGACHDEERLAPLIAMSDVCVAPGEVGLTAMHALVYGTPCITHDDPEHQMPEYEAIVPGRSGLLYRYGDRQSLTATIEEWLSSHPNRTQVRADCEDMIDRHYTPRNQAAIIDAAVRGLPATEVVETEDFAHVLDRRPASGREGLTH